MNIPRKSGRKAKGRQCEGVPYEGLTLKEIKRCVDQALVKHPGRKPKFDRW